MNYFFKYLHYSGFEERNLRIKSLGKNFKAIYKNK